MCVDLLNDVDLMELPKIKSPSKVRRIRILWEKGEWKILKEVIVPSMTLPKSSALPPNIQRGRVQGFWFEATDAEGTTIYRRMMRDPTRQEVEVFEKNGQIHRVKAERPRLVFEILIPDVPEITELRFYASEIYSPKEMKHVIRDVAEPITILKIRRQENFQKRGIADGDR